VLACALEAAVAVALVGKIEELVVVRWTLEEDEAEDVEMILPY
jgi:hypothetical protein